MASDDNIKNQPEQAKIKMRDVCRLSNIDDTLLQYNVAIEIIMRLI